jgi:hypothetical protein
VTCGGGVVQYDVAVQIVGDFGVDLLEEGQQFLRAVPGSIANTGAVRLSARIWVFSSTQSTTARSDGSVDDEPISHFVTTDRATFTSAAIRALLERLSVLGSASPTLQLLTLIIGHTTGTGTGLDTPDSNF